MDPTPQELATFNSILAVFKWLEMADDVGTALTGAMGASDSLRSWARIPDDRYKDTIKGMFKTAKDAPQYEKFGKNILSGGVAGSLSLMFVYFLWNSTY